MKILIVGGSFINSQMKGLRYLSEQLPGNNYLQPPDHTHCFTCSPQVITFGRLEQCIWGCFRKWVLSRDKKRALGWSFAPDARGTEKKKKKKKKKARVLCSHIFCRERSTAQKTTIILAGQTTIILARHSSCASNS